MFESDWGLGDLTAGAVVLIAVIVLVGLAIGILIQFFFLRNLRDLLRRVSDQNRAMEPNHVFLNFIPLFSLVWMIITVIRVRDSARAEFQTRNWPASDDFGYGVGMAYAVISAASLFVGWIPVFGSLLGLGGLVCWIVYWVKTSALKGQLMQVQPLVGYAPAPPHPGQWGALQGPRRSCSSCGAVGEPGDDFCRKCGSRVDASTGNELGAAQTAVYGTNPADLSAAVDYSTPTDASGAAAATCPFCGAAYRANAQFCASCGRPVL